MTTVHSPSAQRRLNCAWFAAASRLTSMTTNRNKTMMAPTYKITCTAKRNGASSVREPPPTENRVTMRQTAPCTESICVITTIAADSGPYVRLQVPHTIYGRAAEQLHFH